MRHNGWLPDRAAACGEIGSQVIGVVESLLVERGDRVTKGQVIAVLRADVERAAVRRGTEPCPTPSRGAGRERRSDICAPALTRARTSQSPTTRSTRRESNRISPIASSVQMREQRRISVRERELASTQLAQRKIRSPFDGVIVERYVAPGRTRRDRAAAAVAQVDPLKVLVVVPAALYGRVPSARVSR